MTISVNFEQGNASPRIVRISTDATLAAVTTAGWYNNVAPNQLQPSDEVEIAYLQGLNGAATAFFSVSITAGVVTLSVAESSVVLPVVSGDFAVFSGTSGAIADLGYLPSNASKTRVVMANGATVANHIMVSTDTTGTSGNLTGTAINDGSIQAGRDTVAGSLISYPATTGNGSFVFAALNAGGAWTTTLKNSIMGQSSIISIPDPNNAVGQLLIGATATPFVSGNLIQASGTAGKVIDSGIAGSGLQILSASITLAQADVQAMYGVPVQIIAAVANKVIVPVQATVYTNFQTAAFANGGVAVLQYDNTAHGAGTNSLNATVPSAEITAASSQIYSLEGVVAGALTGVTNKGLFISNQTGAFTAGNAASTVVITVSYYLVTATI